MHATSGAFQHRCASWIKGGRSNAPASLRARRNIGLADLRHKVTLQRKVRAWHDHTLAYHLVAAPEPLDTEHSFCPWQRRIPSRVCSLGVCQWRLTMLALTNLGATPGDFRQPTSLPAFAKGRQHNPRSIRLVRLMGCLEEANAHRCRLALRGRCQKSCRGPPSPTAASSACKTMPSPVRSMLCFAS